jgi:hypothetical protein
LGQEDSDIGRSVADLLPSITDVANVLLPMRKALIKFNSVSLVLQKKDGCVSMLDVRVLFDRLIVDFGDDFKEYLAADANIVNDKHFNSAVVKSLSGKELTEFDITQLKPFELDPNVVNVASAAANDDNVDDDDYGVSILSEGRKRQRISVMYLDLKKIPITSNVVERFFSLVKLNLTYLRNSMLPRTLENIMFLKLNAPLVMKMTVQKGMNLIKNKTPVE